MSDRPSLLVEPFPEPQIGPRVMTLADQRFALAYVASVVNAITTNTLDARMLEELRRQGRDFLDAQR